MFMTMVSMHTLSLLIPIIYGGIGDSILSAMVHIGVGIILIMVGEVITPIIGDHHGDGEDIIITDGMTLGMETAVGEVLPFIIMIVGRRMEILTDAPVQVVLRELPVRVWEMLPQDRV